MGAAKLCLLRLWEFHKANFKNNETFFPEKLCVAFGKLFSDLLKKECYDVIICRDYFFAAYLVSGYTTYLYWRYYISSV